MCYRCLAGVVVLLGTGFSSAAVDSNHSDALPQGCNSEAVSSFLNSVPNAPLEEVNHWIEYFNSDIGGKNSVSQACIMAFTVFDGTYFEGPPPDLQTFTEWVKYIITASSGDDRITLHAQGVAAHFLSSPHPLLEDVRALGPPSGCAAGQAFQILNVTPRPTLDEVSSWRDYFSSDTGGNLSRVDACKLLMKVFITKSNVDGPRQDFEAFKMWVEYFLSEMGGDSKTSEAANLKAIMVLTRPHPRLEVLKMWVTYLASQEVGAHHTYESANEEAFDILRTPHPCLEDLKLWAKFFMGPQGPHLVPHQAKKQADRRLRQNHPDLEDLKVTAAYLFSPEGGDYSRAGSLEKAFDACTAKEPELSDVKVCDGEGDKPDKVFTEARKGSICVVPEGESRGMGVILLAVGIVCCCGCIILIGAALICKRPRREGVRAPLSTDALEMNVAGTEPSADSFSCDACGACKI